MLSHWQRKPCKFVTWHAHLLPGMYMYTRTLFADVSEEVGSSAGDEQVTERQHSFSTSAHKETSSDDDTSISHEKEACLDSQVQLAEVDPHDTEEGRLCTTERQESSGSMGDTKCQEIVPFHPMHLDYGIKPIPSLQMQEILSTVSCTPGKLIDTYLGFRQLLGNDVRSSHVAWDLLKAADDQHPLLKVAGLAFGVLSVPETASYMEELWGQLQELMDPCSPDYIMARAMKDYGLAWAYSREDSKKALEIVEAFHKEMENGDSSNFFLAPCYTVTVGRWRYEDKRHDLSFTVIKSVKYYADKTLRELKSLKDEWAIIDTFGMKLNAVQLLLWVKKYYTDNFLSTERLEQEIESLLGELQRYLSNPEITTYDKAGFYSVYKQIFENVNKEEFCRCAKLSAELFRENGRMHRAQEEAELSGDTELLQEISQEAQNIP